jgi:hypothetical protein
VVQDEGALDGKFKNPSSLSYNPSVKRADSRSLWFRLSLPCQKFGQCSQLNRPQWARCEILDKGEAKEKVGVEGGEGWT